MPELTFEDEAVILWQAFVTYTNDLNKSKEDLIRAEAQYDIDYEALCLRFSHPPGRPRRRR
jgi:hypothetical protein